MTAVKGGKVSEIGPGQMRIVDGGRHRIALCNVDGKFYAIEDVCTHDDGPLGEGTLRGCELECPRHGARFDVRSGKATRMPAFVKVKSFPVVVKGDDIIIEVH